METPKQPNIKQEVVNQEVIDFKSSRIFFGYETKKYYPRYFKMGDINISVLQDVYYHDATLTPISGEITIKVWNGKKWTSLQGVENIVSEEIRHFSMKKYVPEKQESIKKLLEELKTSSKNITIEFLKAGKELNAKLLLKD